MALQRAFFQVTVTAEVKITEKAPKSLPSELCTLKAMSKPEDYPFMVLGNDPEVTGLAEHKSTSGSVVLVAVSGMRSVLLAAELAEGNKETPIIVLIDISIGANKFWEEIKKFADKNADEKSFLDNFKEFYLQQKKLVPPFIKTNKEDCVRSFFINLFKRFGYDRVREILLNTININQSLADTETFVTLNKKLDDCKIENRYVYASNVAACVNLYDDSDQTDRVLKNIALLCPKLSIHTDYDPEKEEPKKVFLCKNQNPIAIKTMLKLNKGAANSLWGSSSDALSAATLSEKEALRSVDLTVAS